MIIAEISKPGINVFVFSTVALFDITCSCWIRGNDRMQNGWHFPSESGGVTLPKLPLPSTMRKLKSWIPTLTLPGPGVWMAGQQGTGVGDKTTGKGSGTGAANTWGREGVVTSDWGSLRVIRRQIRDELVEDVFHDHKKKSSPPSVKQFCTLLDAKSNKAADLIYLLSF